MATLHYQCMICDGIYKTGETGSGLRTGGKPEVSHGYCSEECFRIYLLAAGFCEQENIEEFMEGNTFDHAHPLNPVGIEQVIEKMQRNRVSRK